MKKPNITEGEWEWKYEEGKWPTLQSKSATRTFKVTGERVTIPEFIFTAVEFGDKPEANAKAISAVPDMIEVLIEIRDFLVMELDYDFSKTMSVKLKEVEDVLEKAGCTEK